MKRSISLAAFVAVVVVLVLWLVLRERGAHADSVGGVAREEDARGEAALDAPIDATVAIPRERTAVETAAPAVESKTRPSPPDHFALTVVRHTSGAPIVGAEVFALSFDDDERRAYEREPAPFFDRAVASGERSISGVDGRVELPLVRRTTLVCGRHERLAGSVLLFGSRHNVRQLVLHDDAALDVEVVDEGGLPQIDVPVELTADTEYGWRRLASGRTRAPDGVAAFAHVGALLAGAPRITLFACVEAAIDPPAGMRVTAEELAAGRVRLVLPPTGELELLVQEPDGSPCVEPVPCQIWLQKAGAAHKEQRGLTSHVELTCERGRVVAPRIGLRGWLQVCPTTAWFLADCAHGPGPQRSGERVTMVLRRRVEDGYPELRGRALDPLGAPLSGRELSFGLAHGDPPMAPSWSDVRTDGEGRFRYVILDNPPGASKLLIGIVDGHKVAASAHVALTGPIASEGLDVGDVVLAPTPIVCAGRVVDESGEPVANASIRIELAGYSSGFPPHYHRATSDELGRFEIRGVLEGNEPPVAAAVRGGYAPARRRFTLGEVGIEIVLRGEASIAGSIVPPTEIAADDVYLFWRATNPFWNRTESMSAHVEVGTNEFRFSGLEPGEYDILLSAYRMVGEPVELATLTLRAGELSRDPRLQRIGVDRLLHAFGFEPRLPSEGGANTLGYSARMPGEPEFLAEHHPHDGHMTFCSTSDEIEIRVRGDGLRTHVGRYRAGTHAIVMQPGHDVRLVFRGDGELPEAPYSLLPMLKARAEGVADPNRRGHSFDAQRECRIAVPEAGEYDVVYCVRRGEFEASGRFAQPQTITVAEADGMQTFEVQIDREKLDKAVAEARE